MGEKLIEVASEDVMNIFGEYDSYLKIIERAFDVTVIMRNDECKIIGGEPNIIACENVIKQLSTLSQNGSEINDQTVNYAISLALENNNESLGDLDADVVCRTILGKPIKPKTHGQKKYIQNMKDKMIVFGIGPAGTGKTYLAMAMAINAFKNDEVSRIILTRPAIEAGEKLGFLPGDLQSKVDPYLRPLYDALYQIMGAENFVKNMEKGVIEVAPLAYMRGRTLDNAYIILDEAQNTTPAQMKMFLTRIGYGSKVVITGDLTQKDLAYGAVSGLEHAINVLKNVDEIGYSYLTSKDVVRHPLVQKIVKAYDDYEAKAAQRAAQKPASKSAQVNRRVKRDR